MRILDLLRTRFQQGLEGWIQDAELHSQRIAVARDPQHGDYQANLAMVLAKILGRGPVEIAKEIIQRVQLDDICSKVEIAGAGFINMRLRDEWLIAQLKRVGGDEQLGIDGAARPRTFVIDFSSPNVAKPMHVGHIRSTVIGDALTRTLRCLGHRVITDNHLGDWGTQFGMIILGYKYFRQDAAYAANPVAELSRLYRVVQTLIGYQDSLRQWDEKKGAVQTKLGYLEEAKAAAQANASDKKLAKGVAASERSWQEAKNELKALEEKIAAVEADPKLVQASRDYPKLGERALEETAKLHAGDQENLQLWHQFLPHCLEEIHHIYDRLGIQFDHEYGESYYHHQLQGVVDDLLQRGLAIDSEGAVCVFLDGFEAPMIVRKQDGAFLYSTTDIATAQFRMSTFQPDAILYVVDHRQSEHFDKLFAVLRKIGIDRVELNHVAFGTVLGDDGKPFKTRSGSVVGLEYLLDESISKAWSVVCNPDRVTAEGEPLSETEKTQISQVVGMGAIKYADLMHNRTSDYVFDIDKMVQLEGKTATYIQYSYSRTQSILAKATSNSTSDWFRGVEFQFYNPIERELALQLVRYEDVLSQAMEEYYPSVIAGYLYDLAKLFASFFDQCPVLRAESEAMGQSRLGLVKATGSTIGHGLQLLGIGVVERM